MVAIFTGLGAGLTRSSATSLGGMGLLGSGIQGRGGESISVNAANGNLLVSQRDEFLTGRGLDIAVDRTYNSLAQTSDRDNNDRWQMGTTRRILSLTGALGIPGSTVQRLGGDGSLVTYSYQTRDGVSAYWSTAGDGAHEKLVRDGSEWVWTDGGSQVTERYAAANAFGEWRIASQTDISGQSLTYSYVSGSDLVDKVTTANGEWVQYGWSGNQITEIATGLASATLTRTRYGYDTSGRLSAVTVDLTPADNSVTDGNTYSTSYTYNDAGLLSRISQTDGSQVIIAYDGSGRLTSLSQLVAGPLKNPTERTTSLGYGSGYTEIYGPDGQTTRLDYDSAGQLTKITAPPAYTGATAQVVEFDYDVDGNLENVTGADGKVTAYTYDADGNQLLATDPNGNTVKRWYDAGNRVTVERTYGVDGPEYTRYAYDSAGRLRFTITADGRVTEYDYDSSGLLTSQTEYPERSYSVAHVEGAPPASAADIETWIDLNNFQWPDGNYTETATTFSYDIRGNLISSTAATKTSVVLTIQNEMSPGVFVLDRRVLERPLVAVATEHFSYDQHGRLLSRHNQGELSETFVYDGLDRLTSSVDLNGGTTSIVFNDAGLQTIITTAGGYTTTQTYNRAGDLISATGSGAYDVDATVTYQYDKLGRVRVSTNALNHSTYYLYDKAGRKTAEIYSDRRMREFIYDASNRVIADYQYLNNVTQQTIDGLSNPNNALDVADIRPTQPAWDKRTWTVYDDGGRVIQTIDGAGGVKAFEYDASDRLIRTTSYATPVSTASLASPPRPATTARRRSPTTR